MIERLYKQLQSFTTAIVGLSLLSAVGISIGFYHTTHEPAAIVPVAKIERVQEEKDKFKLGFEEHALPFIQEFCVDCHAGEDGEAGVDLELVEDFDSLVQNVDLWGRVYSEVSDQNMPPSDADQPTRRQREKLKQWIRSTVRAKIPIPMTPARRMNRIEFENSVRDLLKFKRSLFPNPANIVLFDRYFDPASKKMPPAVVAASHFNWAHVLPGLAGVSTVPVDPPVEHGYSNDYRSLSLSPLLMEKYFEVADSVVNSPAFRRSIDVWDELFAIDESNSDDDQTSVARKRLFILLRRAFRRHVNEDDVAMYLELFKKEKDSGKTFSESMRTVVSAVLVSPNFLFRDDYAPSISQAKKHNDFAMASRLSYFLWASIPDEELLELASAGQLRKKAVLRVQVKRMLSDKRCKSLATDFGMQWLKVQKVSSAMPDKDKYERYYRRRFPPPGISMVIEQLLLFETIMIEDRDIVEFINADYAYLNRHLMQWYQLQPVKLVDYLPRRDDFEDFVRIKWPNEHRGGVISSGAMLVSTSTSTRTSPVYRGAWILDVILNRPPPPPPADVPAIDDIHDGRAKPLNIRQRLDQHREDPACAGCHDRIDPLGYAMENFDPIAKFRKQYENDEAVDTRGTLFGDSYSGSARFKRVLVKHKDKFVRGFVEHVMTYALGRPLTVADMPEIERITVEVLKQDCRFSSVITEVVLSKQFRASIE